MSTVVVLNPRFLGGGQLPAELVDSSSSLMARHHSKQKKNNVTLSFDKHVHGQIAILTDDRSPGGHHSGSLVSTVIYIPSAAWHGVKKSLVLI